MRFDMDFIYITNNTTAGVALSDLGIRWIMVDLEYLGKKTRQADRKTVISSHTFDDIRAMRLAIKSAQLLVRINPIGRHSKNEIDTVVSAGADAVMLPFFQNVTQVREFLTLLNQRCKAFLLLETLEAIENLEQILELENIDYIHVGLNDIHIERQTSFMFEFLTDGSIEPVMKMIKKKKVPFGVGGVGKVGILKPTAEDILSEHIRINSSGVILSRSFMDIKKYLNIEEFITTFKLEFSKIQKHLKIVSKQNDEFFEKNRKKIIKDVSEVVKSIEDEK